MNSFIIECEKIKSNTREILSRAGNATVIAVVKGNGYGFGLQEYISILHSSGIRFFAVTDTADALTIRTLNLDNVEILMLRSTSIEHELADLIDNDVILTIGSTDAATAANAVARSKNTAAKIHVKIDTGMGRYGFSQNDTDNILKIYSEFDSLTPCGIFTHLAFAFKDRKFTERQLERFHSVCDFLKSRELDIGTVHFANSAYLFNFSSDMGDAVRIGSAFTGRIAAAPADSKLSRVGYLESHICEMRTLPSGSTVGYGCAYQTKRTTKIAVASIGYSDGFHTEKARDTYRLRDGIFYILSDIKRVISKKSVFVKVNGKPAKVLGHIGMTHTVCDVTDIDCNIGDSVTFDVNPIYVSPDIPRKFI